MLIFPLSILANDLTMHIKKQVRLVRAELVPAIGTLVHMEGDPFSLWGGQVLLGCLAGSPQLVLTGGLRFPILKFALGGQMKSAGFFLDRERFEAISSCCPADAMIEQ